MKKGFGCYKSWQKVKLTAAEERIVLVLKNGSLAYGKIIWGFKFWRRLEQDEENGKRLAKVRSNLEALVSPRKACLTNLKWAFGCDSWAGPNKCINLGLFKESWNLK